MLTLGSDLLSASLVGEITSSNPADLSVPTTATFALGGLYVVNARFGVTGADRLLDHAPPDHAVDNVLAKFPDWPALLGGAGGFTSGLAGTQLARGDSVQVDVPSRSP